jgi:hypothetical protein
VTRQSSNPDEKITRAIRLIGALIAIEQALQEVLAGVAADPLVLGTAATMMGGSLAIERLLPPRGGGSGDHPSA